MITTGFTVDYLRPAKDAVLRADARVVRAGQTRVVCRCDVTTVDDSGVRTLCAVAQGDVAVIESADPARQPQNSTGSRTIGQVTQCPPSRLRRGSAPTMVTTSMPACAALERGLSAVEFGVAPPHRGAGAVEVEGVDRLHQQGLVVPGRPVGRVERPEPASA